jgi:hypothetical protein
MPKNWSVGEPTNVYGYLEEKKDEINVGDTIEYVSNNQMGWVMYEVVLDDEGKKSLKVKSDYDSLMYEHEKTGGKKRRRKSSKKRKSRRNRKTKRKN